MEHLVRFTLFLRSVSVEIQKGETVVDNGERSFPSASFVSSAMQLLPGSYRHLRLRLVEAGTSLVVNLYKWLLTRIESSPAVVRRRAILVSPVSTLSSSPSGVLVVLDSLSESMVSCWCSPVHCSARLVFSSRAH